MRAKLPNSFWQKFKIICGIEILYYAYLAFVTVMLINSFVDPIARFACSLSVEIESSQSILYLKQID